MPQHNNGIMANKSIKRANERYTKDPVYKMKGGAIKIDIEMAKRFDRGPAML